MKPFSDHFGTVARRYADNRPHYPAELFDWLAGRCADRGLAWDCGTGSGQAALELAARFGRVLATDASAAQIAQATPHPDIEYRVAPAEDSGLAPGSADLVVVAQALHWFDVERFHDEAKRVMKPDGLIAEWSYGIVEVDGDEPNRIVRHYYRDVVGKYWPPERRHVETGYRELPFPFHRLDAPPFAMSVHWDLARFTGYIRSWSATVRCIAEQGGDPVEAFAQQLAANWGPPGRRRRVSWPLSMRVGVSASNAGR